MSAQSYKERVLNRGDALAPLLANEKYPYGPENGPIPEAFFQYPVVQEKLKRMKNNVSLNASNRKRIPIKENVPYFTQASVKEYMERLLRDIDKNKYEISVTARQHRAVFYISKPEIKVSYKFKIHLMFNMIYLIDILNILFNKLIKTEKIPLTFKVLNYSHITAIPGSSGVPNPSVGMYSKLADYGYGTSNTEKAKYGRLAESFIYSPAELKKFPTTYRGFKTFGMTGETKKKKKLKKEIYEFETLFDPVIVFYTSDDDYTKRLLKELLQIFPDEHTRKWVLPHFYPRGNVKINNMVYLANGDFGIKAGTDTHKFGCVYDEDYNDQPHCFMHNGTFLDLPVEYQKIQDSCSKQHAKEQCLDANRFPMAVSDHKLCKWESEECKPQKVHSQHLLLEDYNSIEELYNAVGQSTVLDRFKADNATLPVNYNNNSNNSNNNSNNNNSQFVPREEYVFRNNYPQVENKYRRNNVRAEPRVQSHPSRARTQRQQWTEAAQARRREQNAEYARLHPEVAEHVQEEEQELTEPERIARNYKEVEKTPYADRIAAMVAFLNRYHPYDWGTVFTNPDPTDPKFTELKRAVKKSMLQVHSDKHMNDPDKFAKYTELSKALQDFYKNKIFGGSRRRTRRYMKNKTRRQSRS